MEKTKKILEVKRHVNKPDESYLCDLIERIDDRMVLQYVSDRPGKVRNILFEAGTITRAYYKTGVGYVLWKMSGPDNILKGYLFHICKDQKVLKDRVEYLDLLLDIWIDRDGSISILDRDEVEMCSSNGLLGKEDLTWINTMEDNIFKNWAQIISETGLL